MTEGPGRSIGPILRVAVPGTLSRLGLLGLSITDTILVGRTGTSQLAYLAVALSPVAVLGVVGQSAVTGLPAMVAGLPPSRKRSLWLLASLAIALTLGLCFGLLLATGEPPLRAAQQPADLIEGGAPVLRALAWSLPATVMLQTLTLFLEATGRARLPVLVAAGALVLTPPLDLALIHGVPGVIPEMGATGCAIANSIIRWLMLAATAAMVWPDLLRCGAVWPGWARIARLLRVGAPVSCAALFESMAFWSIASLAGMAGALALAGYQIVQRLFQLAFMPNVALGYASAIQVAARMQVQDRAGARNAAWTGLSLGTAISLAAGLLLIAAPLQAGALFSNDAGFVLSLRPVLMFTAALILFDGLQGVLNATLRGLADGLVPSICQLLAFWGVAVPAAWVLSHMLGGGLMGLLQGFTLGLAVGSLLLGVRLFTHPKLR